MNPLTVRQSFQTANLEAIRAAQDVHEVMVRELAQKRLLEDRMAEERSEVTTIPEAEALRTEERRQRERQARPEAGDAAEEEDEATGTEDAAPAKPADGRLDFLA